MPSTLDEIRRRLDALDASAFDLWNVDAAGSEELCALMDQVPLLPDPRQAIPWLFRFLERLHTSELGEPGPVVHVLELIGGYDSELEASIRRQPTPLTVRMVNRMLNADPEPHDRYKLLGLLREAARHPRSSSDTVCDARDFLDYHAA